LFIYEDIEVIPLPIGTKAIKFEKAFKGGRMAQARAVTNARETGIAFFNKKVILLNF
jgi:hypothetical protein